MTTKQITQIDKQARKLLSQCRLKECIEYLTAQANQANDRDTIDRLAAISETYGYMMRYMLDGYNDPERDHIYAGLLARTRSLIDQFVRRLMLADSPSLYYSIARYITHGKVRLTALIDQRLTMYADSIIADISADTSSDSGQRLDREIFNAIWTNYTLDEADRTAINDLLLDPTTPTDMAIVVTSALMMAILQYPDSAKIRILANLYINSDDMTLTSIALVGLLIAMSRHATPADDRLSPAAWHAITAIFDHPSFKDDLRITFLEMIRTLDTERINRTMTQEILPGMMNLRPEILSDLRAGSFNPEDLISLEANPAWEDMLRKSGVADKIRELSELQQDGSDVFMSTFSHLKSFPFFNDISNWFVPFTPERADMIVASPQTLHPIIDLLSDLPFLCDSDKYSFVLSLDTVPPAQRDLMLSQFKMQGEQQSDLFPNTENAPSDVRRRAAVSRYLQNIYRFFKLFARRDEFDDPFTDGINLLRIPAISRQCQDAETLRVIGEYYFRYQFWGDAYDAFTRLLEVTVPDSEIYQKLGYCQQQLGNDDLALDHYLQGEIFDPENAWLLGRIAAVYRAKKDYDQAIKYYRRLLQSTSDESPTATLHLGYCYMQSGDLEQASRQFYQYQYHHPDSERADRPLAWTLFRLGECQKSLALYQRIIARHATATDYINAGHVALTQNDIREAVNYYRLALASMTVEQLSKAISDDAEYLQQAGVSSHTLGMLHDAIQYTT